jgi:hypothetical protein
MTQASTTSMQAERAQGPLLPMERASRAGGPALLGLAVLVLVIGVCLKIGGVW